MSEYIEHTVFDQLMLLLKMTSVSEENVIENVVEKIIEISADQVKKFMLEYSKKKTKRA